MSNRGKASRGGGDKAAPIALKLLGDPRFVVNGEDRTPRTKRGRALLAYLALSRDATATRARVADLFWGDRGEDQARGSLRQCLLEIRTAMGAEVLAADRESVTLAAGWTSDVNEIEQMVDATDPARIADTIERCGRDVLLGSLFVSDEFDEWLAVTRAAFDARLAEAARRGLHLAIEGNDGENARRIADFYLLRDPGDEDVTVLAMQADAARGATPVAHRRFQKLRDYLASELGATPGPAAVAALSALAAAPVPTPVAVAEPVGGPPLLVVGPFTETGIVSDLRHLSGGVREEVVSGLSRFRDIRVLIEDRLPSTSETPLYGSTSRAYALTANLRVAGERMRVTPVLTRLADREVVWSQPIDVGDVGLGESIDIMVDSIIGAVAPSIERDAVPARQSSAYYDRFLFARYKSYFPANHAEARWAASELEFIIAKAPDMAVAYAPLVRLYNTCYGYTVAGGTSEDLRERAYTLAQTALSLDRDHIHNYTVMGWCHLWRNETAAAQHCLELAVTLNPFHSERLKEASFGNMFIGNLDTAERLIRRSLALDPLPNDNFFEDIGFLNLVRGNFDIGREYFDLIVSPTIFACLYSAICKAHSALTTHQDRQNAVSSFMSRLSFIWDKKVPMNRDAIRSWLNMHLPFQGDSTRLMFNDLLTAVID